MNASSIAPNTTTAAAFLRVDGIAAAQLVGGEELVGSNEDSASGVGDTPSFLDNWNNFLKLEKPLDSEAWTDFLNSELLRKLGSEYMTYTIISRACASISIIASALLIAHVLRSHQGLSTTYHRLMFGLSISDILYSSAWVLNALMVPKESKYMIPGAQGTVATCTAQGFFIFVGALMSVYYNCSICFYYLAIIKYNRSDAYIAKKLESWLHVIPITISLMYGFLLVIVEGYNSTWGPMCFAVLYDPPHCIGHKHGDIVQDFSIPCGRGNAFYNNIMYQIVSFAIVSPPPIIIITTMFMMYRAVFMIERNAARYGVSILRLNVQKERGRFAANDDTNEDTPNIIQKIRDWISCRFHSLRHNSGHAADAVWNRWRKSTISKRTFRKKAVLHMASGYVAAWALFWVPFLVGLFLPGFETGIMISILNPLQGLFNFIVFMSPKVRGTRIKKRSRGQQTNTPGNPSWYKIAFNAYMSRGERRRP